MFVAVMEGRGRQGLRTGRARELLVSSIGNRRLEVVETAAACVSGDVRVAAVSRAIKEKAV